MSVCGRRWRENINRQGVRRSGCQENQKETLMLLAVEFFHPGALAVPWRGRQRVAQRSAQFLLGGGEDRVNDEPAGPGLP